MNELEQLVREFLGADVIVDDRQPSAIQGNRWIRAAVAVLTLLALLALASALVQIGGWKLLRVMGGVVSVVFGIVLIFFAPTSRLNPKRRRAEILGGFTMVVTSLGALLIDILG